MTGLVLACVNRYLQMIQLVLSLSKDAFVVRQACPGSTESVLVTVLVTSLEPPRSERTRSDLPRQARSRLSSSDRVQRSTELTPKSRGQSEAFMPSLQAEAEGLTTNGLIIRSPL